MQRIQAVHKVPLVLTLLALPLLVGSQCAFLFSSGGGSSDRNDRDRDDNEVIVVTSGNFGSPPVEGVGYESGSLAGVTGENGEFQYQADHTVRFFIGDITLGEAVQATPVISSLDLVAEGEAGTAAAINIARLLLSLDADPADTVITIPETVRMAAVGSNAEIASAIEFLDFSDDSAFVNAASQLVAVLSSDYHHTATLVDADSTQIRRINSPGNEGQ